MSNTAQTALLPTTPLACEEWLRTLANPSDLLKMREAGQSEYPYLFGLATMKLAEAHAEYVRLLERQAAQAEAEDLPQCDCGECVVCTECEHGYYERNKS